MNLKRLNNEFLCNKVYFDKVEIRMSGVDSADDHTNAIFEFFNQELCSSPLHQRIYAASRVNQTARALGMETTKLKLLPLLHNVLSNTRTDPAVVYALSKAIDEDKDSITEWLPLETLELVYTKLTASEEPCIRDFAFNIMSRIVRPMHVEARVLFFQKFVSESVLGDLSKTPYLKSIAGIQFCALCDNLLRKEDLERIGRHPSAFVRLDLAKHLGDFVGIQCIERIGETLLADKNDMVVLAALQSKCLNLVLRSILMNPTDGIPAFRQLCTKLMNHESYTVRIEFIKGLVNFFDAFESDNQSIATHVDKKILAMDISRLIVDQIEKDNEFLVRREALLQLSGSKQLLSSCEADRIKNALQLLGENKMLFDNETRLNLAKASLKLFAFNSKLVTLDEIIETLERNDTDANVHLLITESLLSDAFLTSLSSETDRVHVIQRVYQALKAEKSSEYSFNITCWKSVCHALDRTCDLVNALGSIQAWRVDCRGSDFLEKCLIHPSYSVGYSCASAVAKLLPVLNKTDWLEHDLLPMLGRVSLVWNAPSIQIALVLTCEKLVSFFSGRDDGEEHPEANMLLDVILRMVEGVATKASKNKSPVVRTKAASLAGLALQLTNTPSPSMKAHWTRMLETETEVTARREIEKMLRRFGEKE